MKNNIDLGVSLYGFTQRYIEEDGYNFREMFEDLNKLGIRKFELVGAQMFQNYPNPFNPTTNIEFQIAKSDNVKLIIFDILGKEVATLVNESLQPGTYEVTFGAGNLASGIFFYRLQTESYIETKRMMMIK